jgi:sodium-dependent phosphate transporter
MAVDADNVGVPWQFTWLAVFAFLWAFADSFAIGANDVANSFSTAVASKTITHRQAIVLALFAEFTGALVLGSSVTDTVRKKVMDVTKFAHDPYVLMLAMSCSTVGSAVWVLAATYAEMPVSSTHATIGALMGVGFSAFGSSGVVWEFSKGGVLSIVASW